MNSIDMFKAVGKIPADMVAAAELPADVLEAVDYGVSEKQKKRDKRRSITSSPWFAAAVAMIVALGVTAAIVIAGRAGGPGIIDQPAGHSEPQATPTGDPSLTGSMTTDDGRFTFEYRLETGRIFHPGETVAVAAFVTNNGDAFTLEGASSDMHPLVTLIHRDDQYPKDRPSTCDDIVKTIGKGETLPWGNNIPLPADAPIGQYDLVISFAGESVIFPHAVAVTNAVGDSPYLFVFDQVTHPNVLYSEIPAYTFAARIIDYFGEPYTYTGPESGLAPSACLQCGDVVIVPTAYEFLSVHGKDINHIVPGSKDDLEITEEIGPDWDSRSMYFRFDTMNAQLGWYDLVLTYNDTSVVIPNAFRVISDKDIGPFEIKYTLENGTEYKHGDVVYVSPSIKNLGIPFTVTGNMCPFSPTMTILKDGKVMDSISINVEVPGTDDVGAGEEFLLLSKYYSFTISDEWPDGSYDIEFSYKGTTVTYPGAFTVAAD